MPPFSLILDAAADPSLAIGARKCQAIDEYFLKHKENIQKAKQEPYSLLGFSKIQWSRAWNQRYLTQYQSKKREENQGKDCRQKTYEYAAFSNSLSIKNTYRNINNEETDYCCYKTGDPSNIHKLNSSIQIIRLGPCPRI